MGGRSQTNIGYLWSHLGVWVPFCGFRLEVIHAQTWLWPYGTRYGNYITVENSWNWSEMRSSFVRAKDMDDAEWNNDCVGVCWSNKEKPRCSTNANGAASSFVKGARGDDEWCQFSPCRGNWERKGLLSFSMKKISAFAWTMRLRAFHWKGWCGNHLWGLKELSDLFILFPFLGASELLCLLKKRKKERLLPSYQDKMICSLSSWLEAILAFSWEAANFLCLYTSPKLLC